MVIGTHARNQPVDEATDLEEVKELLEHNIQIYNQNAQIMKERDRNPRTEAYYSGSIDGAAIVITMIPATDYALLDQDGQDGIINTITEATDEELAYSRRKKEED